MTPEFSEYDKTTAELVKEEAKEADQQMEVDPHDDRTREFTSTSFSRMRLDWRPEDKAVLEELHDVAERRMLVLFGDAYRAIHSVYEVVRYPVHDDQGTVIQGLWLKDPITGGYVEDYSKLDYKAKEHLLFLITTRLFDWEQKAAQLWGDSMFAKAQWEQALAAGYESSRANGGRTVEDRTQYARRVSYEERYFAIFQTLMSRQADALVRSLTLLGQRLKDSLSS